ncbi:hypothetical protein BpHYR1_043923 [Brachionus plicatilis]|uniref:Uncharacterized protein n=1 Tax=Brachionus plicatilis TaxID=10195 RepID=A0A3M7PBV5_BRAPC|nr:hypothetical protein BpHYR1_043923 [Brachionus plicatilis]
MILAIININSSSRYQANLSLGRDVHYVNHQLGHLTHFKKSLKIKDISIANLLPDLNYLNCYFRPGLDIFSRN